MPTRPPPERSLLKDPNAGLREINAKADRAFLGAIIICLIALGVGAIAGAAANWPQHTTPCVAAPNMAHIR